MPFFGLVPVVLLALVCAWPAAASDRVYLATGVAAPYVMPERSGFLDLLVAELFTRIRLRAEIVAYASAERALINADTGVDDGDAMRVRGLEALYPNLIRIDEKVIDNDFVGYSIAHAIPTDSFQDLKPYLIGYIAGWKVFETALADGYDTTRVQDADQLFQLLRNQRADVVLFESWQGRWLVRHMGLKARELAPPLAQAEMFLYLNRRHANIVERLTDSLRAMKRDGSYQRIVERTLLPIGRGG